MTEECQSCARAEGRYETELVKTSGFLIRRIMFKGSNTFKDMISSIFQLTSLIFILNFATMHSICSRTSQKTGNIIFFFIPNSNNTQKK